MSPVKLPKNPSVVSLRLDCEQSVQITAFFATKKDFDDNLVMPIYQSFQAVSKALVGCSDSFTVCFRLDSFHLYCFSAGKLAGSEISVRGIFGFG